MTREEFQKGVSRLVHVYGERNYPLERLNLIWRKVQFRHSKVFEAALDNLIADNAHAPLLTKILEAIYAAQKSFPELESSPDVEIRKHLSEMQHEPGGCDKCAGWGVVRAYRKDKAGHPEELLICDCSRGPIAKSLPEYRTCPPWLHYYDFYYVLDSDSKASEKLAQFAHIPSLPKEERTQELMRVINGNLGRVPGGA